MQSLAIFCILKSVGVLMLTKICLDVDCNCSPEVSWHSLAALIILPSLSLRNRREVSKPVAGSDLRPAVTPELYAGMGKVLIDLRQEWKGPLLWFNNKTRSFAALVWTLLLWIYWCRCTLKVWDFFFVLTDRMTSSTFRKIKGVFCPSEADRQHVLCRYTSDRILTTKYT